MMGVFSSDERPAREFESTGEMLSARADADAGFPVSPLPGDKPALRIGHFYWIQYSNLVLAEDGRTYVSEDEVHGPVPAKFTGMGGGSPIRPTWDFIGVASELESREVRWVGPEYIFRG